MDITTNFKIRGEPQWKKKYAFKMEELSNLINIAGQSNEINIYPDTGLVEIGTKRTIIMTKVDTEDNDIHDLNTSVDLLEVDSKYFNEIVNCLCCLSRNIHIKKDIWRVENDCGEFIEEKFIHSLTDDDIIIPIKYLKLCSLCLRTASEFKIASMQEAIIFQSEVEEGITITSLVGTVVE